MNEKQIHELAIFRRFAANCPFAIQLDSIISRPEPEPDILCTMEKGEAVAFEMTRLDDKHFQQMVSSPYTFFLLNDDIELNRNKQFLVQKMLK